jgi:hypothetical protein
MYEHAILPRATCVFLLLLAVPCRPQKSSVPEDVVITTTNEMCVPPEPPAAFGLRYIVN